MPDPLSPELFSRFRDLIQQRIGIILSDSKLAFLQARLRLRLRATGLASYEHYYDLLASEADPEESARFIDAVTTHHTFFFREAEHFEQVVDHLLEMESRGDRAYRVWSAACSSGEEPYSLLMTLADRLGLDRFAEFNLKVLATDISAPVLAQAQMAEYETDRLKGVSREQIERYFKPTYDGRRMKLQPLITEKVVFRRLNLLERPLPMKRTFDVVMCRNVLIYFDDEARESLLAEISRVLSRHGLLCVGMTESALDANHDLSFVGPATYGRQASYAPSFAREGATVSNATSPTTEELTIC